MLLGAFFTFAVAYARADSHDSVILRDTAPEIEHDTELDLDVDTLEVSDSDSIELADAIDIEVDANDFGQFVNECAELEAVPLFNLSEGDERRVYFGINFDGVLGLHGQL